MIDRYTIIQHLLDSHDEGVFDINTLNSMSDEELKQLLDNLSEEA